MYPIASHAQPVPLKTVVIDPGHGGADWGAIDGNREKDAVLAIGLQVAKILEIHGVKTILTRNADYFVPLATRSDIANSSKADAFVSVHANYYEGKSAMGVETFHYGSGGQLANSIQNSIVDRLRPVNRGVKTARFYVLRKSTIPAVLVETGFISNAIEGALLSTPEYRNRMADAIARGILRYLQIPYKLLP